MDAESALAATTTQREVHVAIGPLVAGSRTEPVETVVTFMGGAPLGLTLSETTDGRVVVTAVDDESEAAAAPLTLPSFVTAVNDIGVVSKADAIAAVRQVSTPGASFTVTLVAPRAAERDDGDSRI